jgi:hypothetical protein
MPLVTITYLNVSRDSREFSVEIDLVITLSEGQKEDSTTVMETVTELAERLFPKKNERKLEDFSLAMGELSRPKIYLCTVPCNTWLLVPGNMQQYYPLTEKEYTDIYVDAGSPLKRVYLCTPLSGIYWVKGLPVTWFYPSFSITGRIEKKRTTDREFRIENGSRAEKLKEFIDLVLTSASNTAKNRQRVVHVPRQV